MESESIEAFVSSGHRGNFWVLLSAENVAVFEWLHMDPGSFQNVCAGCWLPSEIRKDQMTCTVPPWPQSRYVNIIAQTVPQRVRDKQAKWVRNQVGTNLPDAT